MTTPAFAGQLRPEMQESSKSTAERAYEQHQQHHVPT